MAFGNLDANSTGEAVYHTFNQFCVRYFGSHRDTLYHLQAGKQHTATDSVWLYASERSAALSVQSPLPLYSYIEFGETPAYGNKTDIQERPFYLHVHYLKNLHPGVRYHYRVIFLDQNRKMTGAKSGTFTTSAPKPGTIYISKKTGQPPYVLDKANTTYLVTEDIDAEQTAFDIRAGNITLDLGGHTVTHATSRIDSPDYRSLAHSGIGIRRLGNTPLSGLRIFNGTIKQGAAPNNTDYHAGENMLKPDPERMKKLAKNLNRGFSNIEIQTFDSVEIAGITSEYHLPQTYGMRFDSSSGRYDIHHNVFLDKGIQMFDRHGAGGARSLAFQPLNHLKIHPNRYAIHHNLIKRTRQNAINVATEIHHNEIYVDSWVVNSFAIQPANRDARVHNNMIFLTGYYACGILWAEKNLLVKDNFIHMEGVKTMISKPLQGKRFIETWGEQDILAGMRITNYGKGGTYRENLLYEGNIIIGNARHGSEMRGTEFFSDYSNHGILFTRNIVKVNADDTLSKASCINTQGAYNDRSLHVPIVYRSNTLISNHCNIRFGDDYGQGSNHHFIDCILQKSGRLASYHTFIFDGKNASFGHVLQNCRFTGGAAETDVLWYKTSTLSNYALQQRLQIEAKPGTKVGITDRHGNTVLAETALTNGQMSLPLVRYTVHPPGWTPAGQEQFIERQGSYQKLDPTPYTITWSSDGLKKETKTSLNNPNETIRIK